MPGSQIIPNAVHDVRWIKDDGRPNGGFLQIFNNSGVSSNQSTVDGIEQGDREHNRLINLGYRVSYTSCSPWTAYMTYELCS